MSDVAYVSTRDCSRIPIKNRQEDEWLRRLVAAAKPEDFLLQLQSPAAVADEAIASFDAASGIWWAGRYVGEVVFEGRLLRIEPRFGTDVLMRWLSVIWGLRFLQSEGRYERHQAWLWSVIAHLWVGHLVAGGKHGLPHRRISDVHIGPALRGRIMPRQTALARAASADVLVSVSRSRKVDPLIGAILLRAFRKLAGILRARVDGLTWMPDRAKEIIEEMTAAVGSNFDSVRVRYPMRYTPMTEGFKPAVELSLSILSQQPRVATAGGERKALGVLIDMAEVWELYVAKLLKIGLQEFRVLHVGRHTGHLQSLLVADGDEVGSLRPDVLLVDRNGLCRAVADAKYKTTRVNDDNRTGVITQDLYQLSAYLAGFGEPTSRLDGFLVYPEDLGGQISRRFGRQNPWRLAATANRYLWFASTNAAEMGKPNFSESEHALVELVRGAMVENDAHPGVVH